MSVANENVHFLFNLTAAATDSSAVRKTSPPDERSAQ